MTKKPEKNLPDEMWINPKSNIRGERGNRAYDNRLGVPSGARYLELADLALGLKKPPTKKKKAAAATALDSSEKTEPYSN